MQNRQIKEAVPEYIKDKSKRKITYYKRKKGILKKAIEMSIYCGVEMAIYIYCKEKNKMVKY